MGPAFLAGSVKNEGWDADVFDLNLALNRLRPSSLSPIEVAELLASLDENPVDKISYKDIFGSLTKFLQAYSEGMDLHSETARNFLQKDDPITELGKVVPVFKPNNADDILAKPDDILPLAVRKHYPQHR